MSSAMSRSLWVTRVQLPFELAQKSGETVVTGGRRNNPRGKRVWPICSSDDHHEALQSTLKRAAKAASGTGRFERLHVFDRYGIATFDSEATAKSVSEHLEALEVQWTTKQQRANSGGRGTIALDSQGSCLVDFEPEFLSDAVAAELYQELLCITWIDAKPDLPPEVRQPRLVCYMADDESLAYTYGGRRWCPSAWSESMLKLKKTVEAACGRDTTFNSCLLNLYRDGKDSVPWHADDEPVYGDLKDCTIASVSLGAARLFQIRKSPTGADQGTHAVAPADSVPRWKYKLRSGSLLVMRGATQQQYQHRVPKRERRPVGARINATFRTIKLPEVIGEAEPQLDQALAGPAQCGAASVQKYASSDSEEEDQEDDEKPAVYSVASSGSEKGSNCSHESTRATELLESQRRGTRFAARRLSNRLFIGHGRKKLCPRGVAVLQEAVQAAAVSPAAAPSATPARLTSSQHDSVRSLMSCDGVCLDRLTVVLEMHRGYAFANLCCNNENCAEHTTDTGGAGVLETGDIASLRVITALDGLELHVPTSDGAHHSVSMTETRDGSVGLSKLATPRAIDGDASSYTGYTLLLDVCPATQPVCKHFARTGSCRFGESCHFAHIVSGT